MAGRLRSVFELEATFGLVVDVLGAGLSFRTTDTAGGLREVRFELAMISEYTVAASRWYEVNGGV
jgi:hypothetical protein